MDVNGSTANDTAVLSTPPTAFSWSDALVPIFAFTRVIQSLLRLPRGKIPTSRAVFPTFRGDELRYIVSFGDSYTSTFFNPWGDPPRPSAPMGNPEYPGLTSANGPNWIDFLTVKYNQSYVETVNMAFAGSRLDVDVDGPEGGASIKWSAENIFMPRYGTDPRPLDFPWTGESTLFAFWSGMIDTIDAWDKPNHLDIFDRKFLSYAGVLDGLYVAGARNFVLLNALPVERTPIMGLLTWKANTTEQAEGRVAAVKAWNERLVRLVQNITTYHPDVRAGVIDVYSLSQEVLENPCVNPITCPIRDTTSLCPGYAEIGDMYGKLPDCKFAADEYFWVDLVHLTWRVQEMIADALARELWML